MEVHLEKYFSIVAKDEPGLLARITATLMNEKVEMEGIWGFGVGHGKADVLVVPKDVTRFKEVSANKGWVIREGGCYRIEGRDRAGALVSVLNSIASEGINLFAVDAMAVEDKFACYIWGEEDDIINLGQLLGARSPLM